MKKQPSWRRYARLFGPDPRADMEDELRLHLELRMRDYMSRGMSEEEARAAAAARLGDMDAVRRECAALGDAELRRRRSARWLAELRQDLRYGARMLLRARAFTVMAVLTLAIGIGSTTAIFSLVDAVLLAPLPYDQPDRLVRVWETSPQGSRRNVVSPGNVVDWLERAHSFSPLGAYRPPFGMSLTGNGEAVRVVVVDVQPAVLRALGVRPLLGRTLVEEDATAAGDVLLLSHALWQQRYGGAHAVLGQHIVLNDEPHTVIGVMPPGFAFPGDKVQLWRPLRSAAINALERRSHNMLVIGKLGAGVTVAAARAEMDVVAAGIASEHPEFMSGWGVNVVPLHDDLTAHVKPLFSVLLAGVSVVLLIACGNLANLLLARAVAREREMAVRRALGAGRGRLARQLVTESVLLSALGGAGALLIAPLLLRVLVGVAPSDIPLLERAVIDGRMLLFLAAIAFGCALLFGFAPALRLARTDMQHALRGTRDATLAGHTRIRGALLGAQVALSVVLLVGAGLLVRSFAALNATDLGFNEANLVTMHVDLPRARYPDQPRQVSFHEDMLERVRVMAGVSRVAGTNEPPGGGYEMTFSFVIEGRAATNESGREDPEQLRAVTPGYFEVLGQRVLRGRPFYAGDRGDATPVAIINESLARKHWTGRDPVGARIAFDHAEPRWVEIVGVVADVRLASPDVEPVPAIYIPYAQKAWPWMSWMHVVARTRPGVEMAAMMPALRTMLLELDPQLPPQSVNTVHEAFRQNIARRTFAMTLVAGFGGTALLLCVVGLYGLLAYTVAQQRREIGVRLALGAGPGDVVRRVLRHSLVLALLGATIGVVAAAAASRVISNLLYGVSPLDGPTYALTVLLVITAAVATAAVPARRAARTSPVDALRSE